MSVFEAKFLILLFVCIYR